MKIHGVRKPFMCREGQFNAGKRELCVGIDLNALKAVEIFVCYLGNNQKTLYEIDSVKAQMVGQEWKNPKGKSVIIVPLSIATVRKEAVE